MKLSDINITVEQIMRKLAGEMTIEEIITDHPHLTREDIFAAHESKN